MKENDTVTIVNMVGILLDKEFVGDSNGEFNGNKYFEAGDKDVVFIPAEEVIKIKNNKFLHVER